MASVELKHILDVLRVGQIEAINEYTISVMNNIAQHMIKTNNRQLTQEEVEDLDMLLRICNILYNRTDMTVLPIEDGVYDLLLEKYKAYNPNFQVGSETVPFMTVETGEKKELINPIHELSDHEVELIKEGLFYTRLKPYTDGNLRQFYINPIIQTGKIERRTHNTATVHDTLIGTLDKAKFVLSRDAYEKGVINDPNVSILERDFFLKHIESGIITPNQRLEIIVELKYDGISVEADCDMFVNSARTRGDTGIGQASDITPILYGYPFPNVKGTNFGEIGVKFEAIMQHQDLYLFNITRGVGYKNCRTAIVGLFGSSDGNLYRNYITLVPLEVDKDNIQFNSREAEIQFLNYYYATKGCPIRYAKIVGNYKECLDQIKIFVEEAEVARNYLNFMYDGVVVSYNEPNIREKLGRKNFINKYSIAVKFNPLKRQTRFLGYTFHIGQDGSVTPKIHYEPVEFFGTIHPQSTGNSYARFKELNLRIGDIIEVEYVNDVIDRVTGKVNCLENINNEKVREPVPFIDKCPECGAMIKISPTGKSAYCCNPKCKGRELSRMVNMMAKLNLKDFGEAKIAALDVHSLGEMFTKTREQLLPILGEAFTEKFLERMEYIKTTPIPDYIMVGALGFTGLSAGKWKLVFERMTLKDFIQLYHTHSLQFALGKIKGVGEAMIDTIVNELELYINDIHIISNMPNIIQTFGQSPKQKVVFTGFRDKDLVDYLITKGYDYKENLTKDTNILVIPYAGYTSTKLNHVSPITKVIPKDEFIKQIGFNEN